MRSALQLIAVLALGAAGCTQGTDAPRPDGAPALTIQVAPLSLPDVVEACYDLAVYDEAGATVWSRDGVCAGQFGDGASAITYVGACDATDGDDPDDVATNVVALRIAALYGPDGDDPDDAPDLLDDWQDPCAAPHAPDGCRRPAVCAENADTRVTFDLTILRAARQGFFDVAVDFDAIFCSAKVDCAYPAPNEGPIALVFDPATGERVQTVVWALACTDGDAADTLATSTHLYMSDVELRCGADTYAIPAAAGPGNVYPNGAGAPAPLVQAMVFEGREQLQSDGASADARYWNVALGLDAAFFADDPPPCSLHAVATASRGPLADATTPPGATYPVIVADVPINAGPDVVCTQHPVNGAAPHDGVRTTYAGATPGDATTFANEGRPTADGLDTVSLAAPSACPPDTLDVDGTGTFCAPPADPAPETAVVIPYAATMPPSDLFMVTVDDGVNVYDLPVDERMYTGRAHFAFAGTVEVTVTYLSPHLLDVGDMVVRPRRFGVPYAVSADGMTATFTIDRPGKFIVEGERYIDTSPGEPLAGPDPSPWGKPLLFLFAEALETDPLDPRAPDVVVVEGAGVDPTGLTSSADRVKTLSDNLGNGKTLFFPPGTYLVRGTQLAPNRNLYVHGSARLRAAPRTNAGGLVMTSVAGDNRLYGRGTIDARGIEYIYAPEDFGIPNGGTVNSYGIRGQAVDDVVVEDLTYVDSSAFLLWLEDSERWTFQNVKALELGKWDAWAPREDDPTRWATWPERSWGQGMDGVDGINLDGTRRVLIDDAFIYSADSAVMVRHNGENRFREDGWVLIDDITVRNSTLYNHGGGSSGAIGFWRGNVIFRDVTFDNVAAPQAASTLFLRPRLEAFARIERATWRGVDYESSREGGRFGYIEGGEENTLESASNRIYLQFRLPPAVGAYTNVLLELPRNRDGDPGVTIDVRAAESTFADGVTRWTERGGNALTWSNRPAVGELLQSLPGTELKAPGARNPNGQGSSLKFRDAAITDYLVAHGPGAYVSFEVSLTPNPDGTPIGQWRFYNDETDVAPWNKIALTLRIDGVLYTLYPVEDTVTSPAYPDSVWNQRTVTELDMIDVLVKDVTAVESMEILNVDGETQVTFDDVVFDGTLATAPGHVKAKVAAARTPMELTFTSVDDPVIEVVAAAPVAHEGGADGAFTLLRSGGTDDTVVVELAVRGAAKSGVDVEAIATTATFAPGETAIDVPVRALADGLLEPVESVVIEVVNVSRGVADARGDAQYVIGTRYQAQVRVMDPVASTATDVVGVAPGSGRVTAAPYPAGAGASALVRFTLPAMPSMGVPRYATLTIPWAGGDLSTDAALTVTPVAEDVAGTPWTPANADAASLPADDGPPLTAAYPGELVRAPGGQGAVVILRGEALDAFLQTRASRDEARPASFRVALEGGGPLTIGQPSLTFDIVDR